MDKIKSCLWFILFLVVSDLCGQNFSSSNLPLILIETEEEIPDEPKIEGTIGIIYNGEGELNALTDTFYLESNVKIETRGNSTQGFDKKTYSFELKSPGGVDVSEPLLGMGKEEDWILHAMVIDKSQLRIPMSFDLFRSMGHYASDYRFVEVMINGEYDGLYILCEKIKRDDDRVDIARLDEDDIAGDSLTGGYILRIDWWDEQEGFFSDFESMSGDQQFFHWYYPKADEIKDEQAAYIEDYMNQFQEAVLDPSYTNSLGKKYTDYIDITAFVDFLLINEFSKNSDGYKLSTYLHKDKDSKDGRLKMGPIWDFDQTYGLSTVCSSHITDGWTFLQNQDDCTDLESMPLWWGRLMEDPVFVNHLKCRWESAKENQYNEDSIFYWIDNNVLNLQEPLDRNFERWDFIGQQIWIEPDPFPQTYEEEIDYLKNWISERIDWIDANIPGNCEDDVVSIDEVSEASHKLKMFPNPTNERVTLEVPFDGVLQLTDVNGNIIEHRNVKKGKLMIELKNVTSGMYFLTLTSTSEVLSCRISLVK